MTRCSRSCGAGSSIARPVTIFPPWPWPGVRVQQTAEHGELAAAEVGGERPPVQPPRRAGQGQQGDVAQTSAGSWAMTAGAMTEPWL